LIPSLLRSHLGMAPLGACLHWIPGPSAARRWGRRLHSRRRPRGLGPPGYSFPAPVLLSLQDTEDLSQVQSHVSVPSQKCFISLQTTQPLSFLTVFFFFLKEGERTASERERARKNKLQSLSELLPQK
jgi:hypothetical protein